MSILFLQHHPSETGGLLTQALRDHGHRITPVNLFAADSLPVDLDDITGLVIASGPQDVNRTDDYPWLNDEMAFIKEAHEARLPMVGIGLGAQLIAKALGGEVATMASPEVGMGIVKLSMPKFVDPILQGIRWQYPAFHLHSQEITKLPPGGMPLAMSSACKIQAYRMGLKIYGFQYHFELDQQAIRLYASFPQATQAGLDDKTILEQLKTHYPEYARLSKHLISNIATLLLPVDRAAFAKV